ncbi:MAG: DUF1775 domain-containing protein [Myxococcota bacterium]|nr:DUF1775 domain-containing protein [Myxococcota bacterium]
MLAPAVTHAHVSISSGPAAANKSGQLITFSVGHGCTDAAMTHLDTIKVRVAIPAGVTSVRPLRSDFGTPTVIRTGATITHVEWTKPVAELLEGDDAYYQLTIRAKVDNLPFSRLQFAVEQTCQNKTTNAQTVVLWDQPPGTMTGSPAALLTVIPQRVPGWNAITIPAGTTVPAAELGTYFGDAAIVWRGSSAYSANAVTAGMIAATPGVTPLAADLVAGDELYVKY